MEGERGISSLWVVVRGGKVCSSVPLNVKRRSLNKSDKNLKLHFNLLMIEGAFDILFSNQLNIPLFSLAYVASIATTFLISLRNRNNKQLFYFNHIVSGIIWFMCSDRLRIHVHVEIPCYIYPYPTAGRTQNSPPELSVPF